MYDQGITVHFLEVSASGGADGGTVVTLYGVVNSQSLYDAAIKAAQETAGAPGSPVTIRNEIQIVHEYTVMP